MEALESSKVDSKTVPAPHEVTLDQWRAMTPEERALAGDASRYPQSSLTEESV